MENHRPGEKKSLRAFASRSEKCLARHARQRDERNSPERQRTSRGTRPAPRRHFRVLSRRRTGLNLSVVAGLRAWPWLEAGPWRGAEGGQKRSKRSRGGHCADATLRAQRCPRCPAQCREALARPAQGRHPTCTAHWAPAWVRERRALAAKPRQVQPRECVEWLKLANLSPLALNNCGWSWTKLFFTLWKTAGGCRSSESATYSAHTHLLRKKHAGLSMESWPDSGIQLGLARR